MKKSTFQLMQSAYYFITGVWPIVHIRSFLYVTGWKTDLWLVKTTGILITAIGLALWTGVFRKENSRSIAVLALLSAGGLLAIDVYYTLAEIISPVYLADAALQLIFFIFWLYQFYRNKRDQRQ